MEGDGADALLYACNEWWCSLVPRDCTMQHGGRAEWLRVLQERVGEKVGRRAMRRMRPARGLIVLSLSYLQAPRSGAGAVLWLKDRGALPHFVCDALETSLPVYRGSQSPVSSLLVIAPNVVVDLDSNGLCSLAAARPVRGSQLQRSAAIGGGEKWLQQGWGVRGSSHQLRQSRSIAMYLWAPTSVSTGDNALRRALHT